MTTWHQLRERSSLRLLLDGSLDWIHGLDRCRERTGLNDADDRSAEALTSLEERRVRGDPFSSLESSGRVLGIEGVEREGLDRAF